MTTSRCPRCKSRDVDMIKSEPENLFLCFQCDLDYDSAELRQHIRGMFVDFGISKEQEI